MAAASAPLKEIIARLKDKDITVVTTACNDLENWVTNQNIEAEPPNVVDQLMAVYCDILIKHSNFKICLSGMKSLAVVILQVGDRIRNHFNNLIDLLIDRLGDRQQAVRDFSLDIIIKTMTILGAPTVFDRLRAAFRHKNAHVREHYMICFVGAVIQHGPDCLSFGAFLPHAVKFLSDTAPTVREAATQCIETMYKYSGDALITALQSQGLKPNVLQPILDRLEKVEVVPEDDRVPVSLGPAFLADSKSNTLPRSKTPGPRSNVSATGTTGRTGSKTPSRAGRPGSNLSVRTGRAAAVPRAQSAAGSRSLSPEREVKTPRSAAAGPVSRPGHQRSASRPASKLNLDVIGSDDMPAQSGDLSPTKSIGARSTLGGSRGRSRRSSAAPGATGLLPIVTELRLTDIKAVPVSTEKELQSEMLAIADTIKDVNSHSWEKRIKALHRLAGLVLGGASEFSNFYELLNKRLIDPLTAQVTELRSSVCREACALLCFLARQLRDNFQTLADYFVPILFKLTYVSIQIIADSGNACIRTLFNTVRIQKAIPHLLTACTDKNDTLRARCAGYVLLLLEVQETAYLTKFAGDLDSTVRKLLADRSEEVRGIARHAFWALRGHFPERADRMVADLDDKTVKLLQETRPAYKLELELRSAERDHDRELAVPMAMPDRPPSSSATLAGAAARMEKARAMGASSKAGSRRGSLKPGSKLDLLNSLGSSEPVVLGGGGVVLKGDEKTEDDGGDDLLAVKRAAASSTGTMRSSKSDRPQSSANLSMPSSSNGTLRQSRSRPDIKVDAAGSAGGSKSGTLRSKTPGAPKTPLASAPAKKSGTLKKAVTTDDASAFDESQVIDFSSKRSSMPNVLNPLPKSSASRSQSSMNLDSDANDAPAPPSNTLGMNKRTLINSSEPKPLTGGAPAGVASPPSQVSSPPPQVSSPPPLSNPPLAETTRQRSDSSLSLHSVDVAPAPEVRNRQSSIFSDTSEISDRSLNASSPILLHPGARAAQVNTILVQGRSQNPATRLAAFQSLQDLMADKAAIPDIIINLDKIAVLFQDRIIDVNVKVTEKALAVLIDLLQCVKLKIIPHLEKLVPNVFLKLADMSPSVRHLANAILVKISQDFGGDALYPVILRVLEIDNPKVTTGCLEFLHHLISQPLRPVPSANGSAPAMSTYFRDPMNVRELVSKVVPFVYNTSKLRLRDIAVSILVQVIDHHNEDAIYAELLALPVNVAQLVLPPLEKFLPDLQQRLTGYAKSHPAPISNTPPPHPNSPPLEDFANSLPSSPHRDRFGQDIFSIPPSHSRSNTGTVTQSTGIGIVFPLPQEVNGHYEIRGNQSGLASGVDPFVKITSPGSAAFTPLSSTTPQHLFYARKLPNQLPSPKAYNSSQPISAATSTADLAAMALEAEAALGKLAGGASIEATALQMERDSDPNSGVVLPSRLRERMNSLHSLHGSESGGVMADPDTTSNVSGSRRGSVPRGPPVQIPSVFLGDGRSNGAPAFSKPSPSGSASGGQRTPSVSQNMSINTNQTTTVGSIRSGSTASNTRSQSVSAVSTPESVSGQSSGNLSNAAAAPAPAGDKRANAYGGSALGSFPSGGGHLEYVDDADFNNPSPPPLPPHDDFKETPGNPDHETPGNDAVDSDMAQLAASLSSTDSTLRLEAIGTVVMLAQTVVDGHCLFGDHFDALFLPLLSTLSDPNPSAKESALQAICDVVSNCGRHFSAPASAYSELLAVHMLEVVRSSPIPLHTYADKAISSLALLANPSHLSTVLATVIDAEKLLVGESSANVLALSIKTLSRLTERLVGSKDLHPVLERVVPALASCLQNPNTRIRKEVIFFFVKAHKLLGDGLEPYLSALSISQTKLIKNFITKSAGMPDASPAATVRGVEAISSAT